MVNRCNSLRCLMVGLALACSVSANRAADQYTAGQPFSAEYGEFAKGFLASNCLDCHSGAEPEAGLSLVELGPVSDLNAATWKSVWAQVALHEMPPQDFDQPNIISRLKFSDWIVGQLTEVMKDKGGFKAHLDPAKGNFLNHDLLFGELPDGIKLLPPSSPARLWRVTREEHITRLNELINKEPDYDPRKPGLRTQGDAVPTNHGGELKMYFGTDRIIAWQGGTVAYATSVKSTPAVLSSAKTHGLENYPDFSTVNSAEATQILDVADDIVRYMAYGPLSIAEEWQISDDKGTIQKIASKHEGDIRGLPIALVYNTKVARPLTPVYKLMKQDNINEEQLRDAVNFVFEAVTFRPPSENESRQYLTIVQQAIEKLGKKEGVPLGLSSIFLDRDALFRPELVKDGKADANGRIMLQDWELGLAVNHAFSYVKPDPQLKAAVLDGRMTTKQDVRREVKRILSDDSLRKPRVLQFFRDFFDYDLGGYICKDAKALAETGVSNRGNGHYRAMFDATASTDRLIELILNEDQDVLKQLLTTNKVVAAGNAKTYFGRQRTKQEQKAAAAAARIEAEAKATKEVEAVKVAQQELADFEAWLKANPQEAESKKAARDLKVKQRAVASAEKKLDTATRQRKRNGQNFGVENADLKGQRIYARVSRRSFGNGSMKPERTLATVPEDQRMGILTHPSWLVSHSDAMDNHAIRRGHWIRERLLGGGIPDVPITVDAMLPDEPHNTLRERMRVTREDYCWTCHQKMDPLGLPFEMYNHAGLYREFEKDEPVDSSGEIIDSGDSALDGKVSNALEMIQKIASSERTEQVFVRHAFRFWMGRNETLNDRPVLQAAHKAYKDNNGSMKALLLSLLTSDAFLYRKR